MQCLHLLCWRKQQDRAAQSLQHSTLEPTKLESQKKKKEEEELKSKTSNATSMQEDLFKPPIHSPLETH